MMNRRIFLTTVTGLLAAPLAATAEQAGKVWRVGVLMPDRPGGLEALGEGLRELGYVEGQNLVLDHRRFTRVEQTPTLARELVQLEPDVIVAGAGRAAVALKGVTETVPIVMANSGDAISQGLVASLARPGGNVTAFTIMSPELAGKRLEILKEAAPGAERVGVIGCPDVTVVSKDQWLGAERAAPRMALRLVPIFFRQAAELPGVLERARRQGLDAVFVFDCGQLPRAEEMVGLLNQARIPALYPFPRYAEAGGLMAYGPDTIGNYKRAATFVDKILKGAKPADLPVEQPTKFELVIKLKTAKALGLTIPPSLLLRADQVIE